MSKIILGSVQGPPGRDGLSVTVNGIGQENGNIALQAENIPLAPIEGLNALTVQDAISALLGGKSAGSAKRKISDFRAQPQPGEIHLTWKDPADETINGVPVYQWGGTRIVRKEGSYPANVSDGITVVNNTIRGAYADTPFIDTGLLNGITYYYAAFCYSKTGVYQDNNFSIASAEPNQARIFGVRWNKNETTPYLERLYDSVGKSFAASVGWKPGHSDFDDQPIYRDIKLCNLLNGVVTAYQDDPTFTRTPVEGDVMVEIPKFYYKIEDDETYRTYLISESPVDGFLPSPRHAPHDGNNQGYEKIYVSAYSLNKNFCSVSGVVSYVGLGRNSVRVNIVKKYNGYYQFDYATFWTIALLYLVETACWDAQEIIGPGFTNTANTAQINTGQTDNVATHSGRAAGENATDKNAVKYRHIENLWGNLCYWLDGVNYFKNEIYVTTNPAIYADSTSIVGYTKLNYIQQILPADSGFIKQLGFDPNIPWAQAPIVSGGAEGTFIPDRVEWISATSSSLVLAFVGGGAWDAGSNAGLFYHIKSNSTSQNTGVRSIFLPQPTE